MTNMTHTPMPAWPVPEDMNCNRIYNGLDIGRSFRTDTLITFDHIVYDTNNKVRFVER